MNHRHRKTLHALFAHPIAGNLSPKELEGVFLELGAEVDTAHSGKLHVTLNGRSANFAHPTHTMPHDEVVQVRKFLQACGVDPADYPS